MNYKILTASTPKALEVLVNEAIADGWDLQGGVAVAVGFSESFRPREMPGQYVQAMVHLHR